MGVARIVRVATPYTAVQTADIDFAQSADTMYLACIDLIPYKLLRSSHTAWSFATVSFGPDNGPPTGVSATPTTPNTDAANSGNAYFPQDADYTVTAINDETGQESRSASTDSANNDLGLKRNYNTITWVAPADGLADRYNIYKADNQQAFGYIGTTTGLTFRDDNIGPDLTQGPPEGQTPFSGTNMPSTVAFYQQRLFWARTSDRANAIYASKVGDYENMDRSRPIRDDDSFSFALVSTTVNAINRLVPMKDLMALTSDSIFRINGGEEAFIGPLSINAEREAGVGASRLRPVVIDDKVFFQPAVGSAIRVMGFKFEVDGYTSSDITLFSPHFFETFDIVDWAYLREPRSQIWAVRSDGKLLCFTWEAEQEVWGWTLCETSGTVEHVCAISESGEDRLYLVVRRSVGGEDRCFVERMASSVWDDIDETCFLDCATTFVFSTPSNIVRGLRHLAGETVAVVADGSVYMEREVTAAGTLTLPNDIEASTITVGLPYDALIETLPLAMQSRGGWTIAKPSTVGDVVVKVANTRGVLVGPDEDNLLELPTRSNETMDQVQALKNGNYIADMQATTRDELTVVAKMPYPLPSTITAILFEPKISE